MKRKILIIVGLVVVALLGFLFLRSRRKLPSFSVQTASVGEMTVSVSASGKVKAESDTTLKFQTSGLLSWVGVKEGDTVKKWQAIASLDKRNLQKQFQKQMNDYLTQRWSFEQTQDDYKQTKDNYLVTDAIKKILDKTQFSLDNSVLDVEIADLAVKFSTINSPFDGIVVAVSQLFAGVNITPIDATFRIVDPKSVYFETQVDETDVNKIKVGDEANISLDAFPEQTLQGKIEKISFDSIITAGGGTAYKVKVSFPVLKKDEVFRLGMNGDVEIISQKLTGIITVPSLSIVQKDNKNYLWKAENNKAKLVEVKLGASNGEVTQIVSGLSSGDKYITANISLVKEGLSIK